MILCDVKDNKRCVVLSILLVCLVSVLCSCGSMSEEEKLQKMAAEDPLITSSRETSAHMKESIEKAKQYIPDTSESDESDPESRVRDEVNEEKETGEDIQPDVDSEPDTSQQAEAAPVDIPRSEDITSDDVRIRTSGSDSGSSDSDPSVVITSTDTNIDTNQEAAAPSNSEPIVATIANSNGKTVSLPPSTEVWKSKTGKKFHKQNNCGNMDSSAATLMTVEEAVRKHGLEACDKCYPPDEY